MIQIVRLAADGAWTLPSASLELRERVPDETALFRARANLSKILAESSSEVIERAAAIVDVALSQSVPENRDIDHVASCGWPFDGPCPRCSPPTLTAEG